MRKRQKYIGMVVLVITCVLLCGCALAKLQGNTDGEPEALPETAKAGELDAYETDYTEIPVISHVVTEENPQVTIYVDPREPQYEGTETDMTSVEYLWESFDGQYNFTITVPIDQNVYRYYKGLDRYLGTKNYVKYLYDSCNEAIIQNVANGFRRIQNETNYSTTKMIQEILHFVQSCFTYVEDADCYSQVDYPKYPVETLIEKSGDCEDTSLLAAYILHEMGYGCALLLMPNHCAVGVLGTSAMSGTYYLKDQDRYYYVETTIEGYGIGMVPENVDAEQVTVYVVE